MDISNTDPNPSFESRVSIDPPLEGLCAAAIAAMRRSDWKTVRATADQIIAGSADKPGYRGRGLLYRFEVDLKTGDLGSVDSAMDAILPLLGHDWVASYCRALRLYAEALTLLGRVDEARLQLREAVAWEKDIDRRDRMLRARLENSIQQGYLEWSEGYKERARVLVDVARACLSSDTDVWNAGQLDELDALLKLEGDPAGARTLFDSALEAFSHPQDQLDYERARALDRWGTATVNRDLLAEALSLYEALGARHHANVVRAALEPRVTAPTAFVAWTRPSDDELAKYLPEGATLGGDVTRDIFVRLHRVATTGDRAFCLQGPTGVGKEIYAAALAKMSVYGAGPYEVINCGSWTGDTAITEMFGHERGAFTGAIASRAGVFERARRGVVFLDEVQNLNEAAQAHLLRVLQEREVRRLGSGETRKVDFALIAGTNLDLQTLVEEGKFREDLFYRLNSHPIHIPPLDARNEEIPHFAMHFARAIAAERKLPIDAAALSPDALTALKRRSWPGNLRELRHFMATVLTFAEHSPITAEDIERADRHRNPGGRRSPRSSETPIDALNHLVRFVIAAGPVNLEGGNLNDLLKDVRRAVVDLALARDGGVNQYAAQRLGIPRNQVYRTIDPNIWDSGKKPSEDDTDERGAK